MANVKISELPVATSLSNGDSFPVVQGGVTKQAARSVLFASPTFTGTTTADLLTATGDVTFDGGAFVFNESGADKDARFEGDTDANLLFLDASTDRVGIGTATPSTKLHISGTGNTGFTVQDSGGVSFVDFVTSAGTNRIISGLGGTANLGFYTASTLRATIDDSGNVGIGTASPAAKLHITNTSATSGSLSLASPPAGSGGSYIIMGNADSGGAAGPSVILASNRTLQFGVGTSFTSNTGGTFSEQMRLDASGNLGIGTSSPGANLQVGAPASGSQVIALAYSATSAATIDFRANGSAFGAGWIQHDAASGAMRFATAGNERMRLDASGNLIYQVNGTAPTLSTNSTMSFELTSNTSLKIVVRGTDGVTRSVSLTLA